MAFFGCTSGAQKGRIGLDLKGDHVTYDGDGSNGPHQVEGPVIGNRSGYLSNFNFYMSIDFSFYRFIQANKIDGRAKQLDFENLEVS